MSSILVIRPNRTNNVGGAARRSAQILETAKEFAAGSVHLLEYQGLAKSTSLSALRGLLVAPSGALRQASLGIKRGLRFGAFASMLQRTKIEPDIIFWETHTNPLDVAGGLIRQRWPQSLLCAFPNNVEALVPKTDFRQNAPVARAKRLRHELAELEVADVVAGISAIDTDVFSLFGLPSLRFPYHPTASQRERFDRLRAHRKESQKSILLILGSAINIPTRLGMQVQFTLVDVVRQIAPNLTIVMAGRSLPTPPDGIGSKISVVNDPTDAELDELLIRARALWVHQAQTTGALIRVADALSAGVPVVGNRTALQDYAACPGAVPYEDTSDSFTMALGALFADAAAVPRLLPSPGLLGQFLSGRKAS